MDTRGMYLLSSFRLREMLFGLTLGSAALFMSLKSDPLLHPKCLNVMTGKGSERSDTKASLSPVLVTGPMMRRKFKEPEICEIGITVILPKWEHSIWTTVAQAMQVWLTP